MRCPIVLTDACTDSIPDDSLVSRCVNKIAVLNDSRYIGMNVYNVVTVSVTVVVMSYLAQDSPTLTYVMQSAMLHASTTTTLCLLFIPKIYAILCAGGDPVVVSAGISVQRNVRRFATDERKDLYARTEIQNRVYKGELQRLQAQYQQLQKLVDMAENASDSSREDFSELLANFPSTPLAARHLNDSKYDKPQCSDEYMTRCNDSHAMLCVNDRHMMTQ